MGKFLLVGVVAWAIAAGASAQSKSEPGLIATYTDGKATIVTLAATPDFALKDNESIHPQLAPAFTAHWDGVLKLVKRGAYTIRADGAPQAKIVVDGKELAADPVELDIGDHPIQIKYQRQPGPARLELMWSADFFAPEPVPSAVLAHMGLLAPGAEASRDVDTGRFAVEQMNCIACHQSESKILRSPQAPDLSHVGSRLRPAWIAKWLENPSAFRELAWMPTVPATADDRRDIATYLATLKNPNDKVKEPPPSPSRVEVGRQLFESAGCAACHSIKWDADHPKSTLAGLGSKWLAGQLAEFLLNPSAIDRSGRMPSMLLDREEALSLAEYLVQSKNPAYEAPLAGGNAARGEELVRSSGCLNCHLIETAKGKLVATSPAAVALERMRLDLGCLAEKPAERAVSYGLLTSGRLDFGPMRQKR